MNIIDSPAGIFSAETLVVVRNDDDVMLVAVQLVQNLAMSAINRTDDYGAIDIVYEATEWFLDDFD